MGEPIVTVTWSDNTPRALRRKVTPVRGTTLRIYFFMSAQPGSIRIEVVGIGREQAEAGARGSAVPLGSFRNV